MYILQHKPKQFFSLLKNILFLWTEYGLESTPSYNIEYHLKTLFIYIRFKYWLHFKIISHTHSVVKELTKKQVVNLQQLINPVSLEKIILPQQCE